MCFIAGALLLNEYENYIRSIFELSTYLCISIIVASLVSLVLIIMLKLSETWEAAADPESGSLDDRNGMAPLPVCAKSAIEPEEKGLNF